jgi:hypothetical protein
MSTDKSVSTGSDKSVSYMRVSHKCPKPEKYEGSLRQIPKDKLADEQTKLPLRFS